MMLDMYEDPVQIGLMLVVTVIIDHVIRSPVWRKWLGLFLFPFGLFSLLFVQAWSYYGIDLMLWKAWCMMMGSCLFFRRYHHVQRD